MELTKKKRNAIVWMLLSDYLMAVFAWAVLWFYRQTLLHEAMPQMYDSEKIWNLRDYLISLLIIPSFWVFIYYLSGTYFDLYRKSRLLEIYRSLIACTVGCFIIGVIAFANDTDSFSYFIKVTTYHFLLHTLFLVTGRLVVLYKVKKDLVKKSIRYNTLIVGNNGKATKVFHEIRNNPNVLGNEVVGFVNVDKDAEPLSIETIPYLGDLSKIEEIIANKQIEEVVIAVDSHQHEKLELILARLSYTPVIVKVLPDMYDIISGSVKINNIYQPVLISIYPELLPDWQKVCKRVIDILASLFAIVLLSPLYLLAAVRVRFSSAGPIIFRQERIGLNGKPFNIFKFRSMYVDAEINGPLLSKDDDPRITNWGKIMRKWRIDETPQFFNILKGEMSLVGPRPERKYYIDLLVKKNPHYRYLHRVKPGLTSLGMVEYGYAENIEQMVERMKYDLLYIKNCSIFLDIKIMIYTVKVILQGRGK